MKRIVYVIFLCLFVNVLQATGSRNLMLLNNWKDETLEHGGQLEAISMAAMDALEQKAGAIIMSSQTWRNIIGRGENPIRYNEWIIKKLSDYLYLFVPRSYLTAVKAKKDSYTQNLNTVTSLSQDERDLGLKIDKFPDISQTDLYNVNYHKSDLNINDYRNLTRKTAHASIEHLISSGNADYGEIYVISQHVLYILGKILITRSDVMSKVDPRSNPALFKQETETNEAYLLHEWLVYLDGHGGTSEEGFVQPVVIQKKGQYPQITNIGVTSGLEHNTFQSLLKFFNGAVVTGALLYTSCYAGGPHLAKLFEETWDAFLRNPEKQVKKDSYNYLIMMTNIWYTATYSGVESFPNFFNYLYAFLHPVQKPVQKKYVKGKKKQAEKKGSTFEITAQLANIIRQVTQFDLKKRYQVPGVRFPYTEWFVAIDDPKLPIMFEKSNRRYEQSKKSVVKEKKTSALQSAIQKKLGVQLQLKAAKQEPPIAAMTEQRAKELEAIRLKEEKAKEKKLYTGAMQLQKPPAAGAPTAGVAQPTVPAGQVPPATGIPAFTGVPAPSPQSQLLTDALTQLGNALQQLTSSFSYRQPTPQPQPSYTQVPAGGPEPEEQYSEEEQESEYEEGPQGEYYSEEEPEEGEYSDEEEYYPEDQYYYDDEYSEEYY